MKNVYKLETAIVTFLCITALFPMSASASEYSNVISTVSQVNTSSTASDDEIKNSPNGNTAVDEFLKSKGYSIDEQWDIVKKQEEEKKKGVSEVNQITEPKLKEGINLLPLGKVFVVENGEKVTGWYKINGWDGWRYFDADGNMVFDTWKQDSNGNWYYLDPGGRMVARTGGLYIDGYYIDDQGRYDSQKNNFSLGNGCINSSGEEIKFPVTYIGTPSKPLNDEKYITLSEFRRLRKEGPLVGHIVYVSSMGSEYKPQINWDTW